MKTVGIICEYDPLHLGHKKQLDTIRALEGPDCGIVCLMSGDFVQRGKPAIMEKSLRARAAILSGADLVLEAPTTLSLSSAEGFAAKGVSILGGFCHKLCFGAETAQKETLLSIAQALVSDAFPPALRRELDQGRSFPVARTAALGSLGLDGAILTLPNNILAVEYCKAILSQQSAMEPMPIHRPGSYHAAVPDPSAPSATSLRQLLYAGGDIRPFVPESAVQLYHGAALHSLASGERAILYRLRTMTEQEFATLPYGSEGLWRKLMHASRTEASLEAIATDVKSKRYTRTRIDRMIMCAFLGLTEADIQAPPPYARVLALNDKGRQILNMARKHGPFPNAGEGVDHPYQAIEDRIGALYGLFAISTPEAPTIKERVMYSR
ncbi:MAG: nucleotidyltransferase family protein [Oscillospiraceae bacterium]|nr:nucleotidyltransferase family protein [Oscillospiraceae bacterium]